MKTSKARITRVFIDRHGLSTLFKVSLCCVFLLTVQAINPLIAQRVISSKQILSDLSQLPGYSILQEGRNFLQNVEQGMPLVDEMEFRTETDEMEFNRQEYLFRVSFNNKKARRAQDRITDNNIRFYELRTEMIREAELLRRYELMVDWYYMQMELEYYQAKNIILEDRKTVFEKMLANAETPDITNLLKIDEDLQELERDIFELENQRSYIIEQLGSKESAQLVLDTSDWISIETMDFVLNETANINSANLEQALQMLKIDAEQLEFELEQAQSRRFLDFIQLKYAGRNNLDIQREFSFGLGLQIPTKTTNRLNINEALLDKLDEEFEMDLLEKEIEGELAALNASFTKLREEAKLIRRQIAENRFEGLFEKYKNTTNLHPLALLSMKEMALKNERTLYKIEKEACLTFIEILQLKGMLRKTPATNYLSDNLEVF